MRWGIQQAVRQFCQHTRYLRESIVISQVAGQSRYKLAPNWLAITQEDLDYRNSLDVIGVKAIEVDGSPFRQATPELASGSSGVYVLYEPDEVVIFFASDSSKPGNIEVSCVLRPKIDTFIVPASIATLYAGQVANGALARLKMMPNEAWTDMNGAALNNALFNTEMDLARFRADRQGATKGFYTLGGW